MILNPDIFWRQELIHSLLLLFLTLRPYLMVLDDGTTPIDTLIVLYHWTSILRTILVIKGDKEEVLACWKWRKIFGMTLRRCRAIGLGDFIFLLILELRWTVRLEHQDCPGISRSLNLLNWLFPRVHSGGTVTFLIYSFPVLWSTPCYFFATCYC